VPSSSCTLSRCRAPAFPTEVSLSFVFFSLDADVHLIRVQEEVRLVESLMLMTNAAVDLSGIQKELERYITTQLSAKCTSISPPPPT
jgi:hypothetical protein